MMFIRGVNSGVKGKVYKLFFTQKPNLATCSKSLQLYFSQAKPVPDQQQTCLASQPASQPSAQSQIVQATPPQLSIAKRHFQCFPVQSYEVGQRLDRYLKNTNLNWTLAQKYLRARHIYIQTKQGQMIKDNTYRLQPGDTMYVRCKIAAQLFHNKQTLTQQIAYQYAKQKLDSLMIFDNKNITVLNKPPNFSVQGGDNIDRNLFSLMAARYKRQMVHVIHRLDKPTTGVLLFCKNLRTAQLIQAAIESRKDYNKYYLALAIGQNITQSQEYIRCNIEWTNKHKARMTDSLEKQQSKDSITYYKKLHSKDLNLSGQTLNLLGVKLITGRKHQIRCHLTDYLQNPILNDKKYGAVILDRNDIKKQPNQDDQKNQYGYIYLHALMTTINNEQIATQVFDIPEDKLVKSRNDGSLEVIEATDNGSILLQNGQVKIVGNLPRHWKQLTKEPHQSASQPNLKQIVLDYPLNQIQMGSLIEKSQQNLWKKHQPRKNVITIQ